MKLAGAGYVAVKTVDSGVSFTKGFYFDYGAWSSIVNNLAIWELIVICLWMIWSLTTTILALVGASMLWNMLDLRLAEAEKDSTGLETPLDWDKAIKTLTLLFVVSCSTVISAYALGEVSNPVVSWYGEYDNDE